MHLIFIALIILGAAWLNEHIQRHVNPGIDDGCLAIGTVAMVAWLSLLAAGVWYLFG